MMKTKMDRVQNLNIRTEQKIVVFVMLFVWVSTGSWAWGKEGFRLTSEEKSWANEHPIVRVVANFGPPPLSLWGENQKTQLPTGPPIKEGPEGRPEPPMGELIRPARTGFKPGLDGRPMLPPGETDAPLIVVPAEDQSNFQGIAADYLATVSEMTGIKFRVTHVLHNNFKSAFDALFSLEVDLMPILLLRENDEIPSHLRGLHVTRPYIRIPVVIVTRPDEPYINDVENLKNMKVSGVLSTREKLGAIGLDISFTHVSPREGLMGVATGRFDAFICEMSSVSQELSKSGITNVKISGELPAVSQYAMLVGPEMAPFVSIFNRAIDAISPEKKDMIWRKWFRVNYEKKLISSVWVKIGLGTGILMIITGVLTARHFYKRFQNIRTTVEALDPHLLSVNVDRNILITEVTEALCNATGFKTNDLLGKPLMALGRPLADRSDTLDSVWKILESGKTWRGEVKIMKKDGSAMFAEAVVSPLRRKSDDNSGFTIIYQDVTQKKHYETLAVKDELTGLYNRRHFNETVPEMLKNAQKAKSSVALFLMDVDYFKKYNDHYGHPEGDLVLSAIGKLLRKIFQRRGDKVFRLGGEEFGAAVMVTSLKEAEVIAEKILDDIKKLEIEHIHNPPGVVTVSVGVTVTFTETPDLDTIYKSADNALYKAKESGRNQFSLAL